MESLFIQLSDEGYLSKFPKIDHYDWFCGPGSQLIYGYADDENISVYC